MTDSDGNDGRGNRRSFWTSLGGILTGVAGVISAVAAVLALLVAGGGSGSSSGGSESSSPATSDEAIAKWAERANEICKDTASDITALGGADTPEQLVATIPRARLANDQLAAVSRPAGARDRIARMIALTEKSYSHIEAAITASGGGDDQAAREAVSEAAEASAQADALATELGANSCVESPAQAG